MKPLTKNITIALAGVSLIALLASPLVAGGTHGAAGSGAVQSAYMSQGHGGGMMGGGMMGGGMMGHGMMGHGMMGHGMMGAGMMGSDTAGKGDCPISAGVTGDRELSVDDVRAHLERNLERHGNARLKVGDVTETDDDTIVAEIVTVDDSLVQRMVIDRHTGQMRSVE